jgi:hypothetical protein
MKRLKIYESFRTEQEIKDLCSEYGIWNYQIRDDGSIDVEGDVILCNKLDDFKQLPLNFNVIKGDFDCSGDSLTTLEYSPKMVDGEFYCQYNYHITSLEGLENTNIDSWLDVEGCRDLYSLKGFPKKVGYFNCRRTPIYDIYDKFIQECDYETMRRFNKFDVIYTDGLDWFIDYDNLGKFLRSVGKEDLMMSKEDFDNFISTTEYRWDY